MTTRRDTESALQSAANRLDRTGASRKQTAYLASLLDQQGKDHTWILGRNTNATLNSRQASSYINDLLNSRGW